jgi:hypothetical protein
LTYDLCLPRRGERGFSTWILLAPVRRQFSQFIQTISIKSGKDLLPKGVLNSISSDALGRLSSRGKRWQG